MASLQLNVTTKRDMCMVLFFFFKVTPQITILLTSYVRDNRHAGSSPDWVVACVRYHLNGTMLDDAPVYTLCGVALFSRFMSSASLMRYESMSNLNTSFSGHLCRKVPSTRQVNGFGMCSSRSRRRRAE
jgi:hypothetical protein